MNISNDDDDNNTQLIKYLESNVTIDNYKSCLVHKIDDDYNSIKFKFNENASALISDTNTIISTPTIKEKLFPYKTYRDECCIFIANINYNNIYNKDDNNTHLIKYLKENVTINNYKSCLVEKTNNDYIFEQFKFNDDVTHLVNVHNSTNVIKTPTINQKLFPTDTTEYILVTDTRSYKGTLDEIKTNISANNYRSVIIINTTNLATYRFRVGGYFDENFQSLEIDLGNILTIIGWRY